MPGQPMAPGAPIAPTAQRPIPQNLMRQEDMQLNLDDPMQRDILRQQAAQLGGEFEMKLPATMYGHPAATGYTMGNREIQPKNYAKGIAQQRR